MSYEQIMTKYYQNIQYKNQQPQDIIPKGKFLMSYKQTQGATSEDKTRNKICVSNFGNLSQVATFLEYKIIKSEPNSNRFTGEFQLIGRTFSISVHCPRPRENKTDPELITINQKTYEEKPADSVYYVGCDPYTLEIDGFAIHGIDEFAFHENGDDSYYAIKREKLREIDELFQIITDNSILYPTLLPDFVEFV